MGWFISIIYEGETPVNISDCRFINNQEGMYNAYTGYFANSNRLNVQSSLFTQNSRGLYHVDYAGGSFTNCSFINNENEGIYIGPWFSSENSSFLSSNLFGNGSSYEVSVGCCNDENIRAEVNIQLSNWDEETTAEMNDGDNPKNISRIQDWWDDDRKAQVNYAGWIGGSGGIGYTGDVLLTDSDYNDIGEEYPAGTETIYVQVYDSDVTGFWT